MGRIIGIDYGRKRVGVAVTDPLQIICTPLTTVKTSEIESFLLKYIEKESVEEIVVGYPVQLNNTPSESVKYIDPFLKRLTKIMPSVKVSLADERFTSAMALRAMIDGGASKKQRMEKENIDKISATIILQSHMEKKHHNKAKGEKE
jgi:putative holliday junction resolvase